MNTKLTDFLNKTFPNLYRGHYGRGMGFECGDGWFDIIAELSTKLEAEIMKQPEEDRQYVMASQVKEKYGTLSFYMSQETDEMSKLISEAEDKSDKVCEECGQVGKIRHGSWTMTLCDIHFDAREKKYIERV